MKPENANPNNFQVQKIIYTDPNGNFSIAIGEYDGDGVNRFAMRWNGDINNPNDKGYPTVFSNPMWFQLPFDIKDVIATLVGSSNSVAPK